VEPFALQSSAGLIRPAIELQSDLAAVLRAGRVLGGEVLQTLDGDTLLIGIGSHRVPARARVRMQPGHKFLFQVERDGDGIVLRVLGGGAAGESGLLEALRKVVGQDQPIGELLERLAAVLRSGSGTGLGDGAGLLGDLAAHLFRPGADAGALREQLSLGGLGYEARLGQAALSSMSPRQLASLAAQLQAELSSGLLAGCAALEPDALATALRAALTDLLGGRGESGVERWLAGAVPGEGGEPLPRDLTALLERALAAAELGERGKSDHARVLANLHEAGLSALPRGLQGVLLRSLLGLAPAGPGPGGAAGLLGDLELLGGDLKGRLLRALGELPEGAVREAVARTLAGIEAEQLLNLARAEGREPLHWSFPVADGERWTTAHLFLRRPEDDEDRQGGASEHGQRLTVAVDFTHTGPIRADLLLRSGGLAMRVTASRPDVVERLRAGLGELETRLATGGRKVWVAVAQAPEEEVRFDSEARDIRFLREHHLMDARA
jgi:hypothetical protein